MKLFWIFSLAFSLNAWAADATKAYFSCDSDVIDVTLVSPDGLTDSGTLSISDFLMEGYDSCQSQVDYLNSHHASITSNLEIAVCCYHSDGYSLDTYILTPLPDLARGILGKQNFSKDDLAGCLKAAQSY